MIRIECMHMYKGPLYQCVYGCDLISVVVKEL
jgi:hypothetical protein